jgi:transcriptional regulator with XRE-family HTH domain
MISLHGNIVKEIRLSKGWSQDKLAFKSQVSRSTIRKVEGRQGKIAPHLARSLVEALGHNYLRDRAAVFPGEDVQTLYLQVPSSLVDRLDKENQDMILWLGNEVARSLRENLHVGRLEYEPAWGLKPTENGDG